MLRSRSSRLFLLLAACAVAAVTIVAAGNDAPVAADEGKKPNIVVIWGDDIGWSNPSVYHRGMMGYKTPNIDRIASEGVLFTDGTGSRAARPDAPPSLTGQSPIPHRPAEGRPAGRQGRAAERGSDHRRTAQERTAT